MQFKWYKTHLDAGNNKKRCIGAANLKWSFYSKSKGFKGSSK